MNVIAISGQINSGKDTVSDYLVENYGFCKVSFADPLKRFCSDVFEFDKIQLWGPSSARNAFDPRYGHCEIKSANIEFKPGISMRAVKKVCDKGWAGAAERLLEYGPKYLKDWGVPDDEIKERMETLCFCFASVGHKYPDLSPRIALQYFGTDWARETISYDIWAKYFVQIARKVLEGGNEYTAYDGVFPSEENYQGVVCSDLRFQNEVPAVRELEGTIVKLCRKATDDKAHGVGMVNHTSEKEQQSIDDKQFDVILMNDSSLKNLHDSVEKLIVPIIEKEE